MRSGNASYSSSCGALGTDKQGLPSSRLPPPLQRSFLGEAAGRITPPASPPASPGEAHLAPAAWDPRVGRSVEVSWGVLGLPELVWAQAAQHLLASQVLVLFWGGGAQGTELPSPHRATMGT